MYLLYENKRNGKLHDQQNETSLPKILMPHYVSPRKCLQFLTAYRLRTTSTYGDNVEKLERMIKGR